MSHNYINETITEKLHFLFSLNESISCGDG